MKNLQNFSKQDIETIEKLINIKKKLVVVDIGTAAFFLPFLLAVSIGCFYMADESLGFITGGLLLLPFGAIIYSVWDYKNSTIHFRADRIDQKKYQVIQRIEKLDTRTDGWTVQAGYMKFKTIYKSFDYFIKAGEYVFITKDKVLYSGLKMNDIVILEVATNSKHVLKFCKSESKNN